MMRVITGTAKGKKLKTLEGDATRPTSKRIKGAIFSSIQFEIEGRRVLDLFAGSGQMGIEALSRGAERAFFVDSSREAMEIVRENLSACGFTDRARYLVQDYRNYIRKAAGREKFDLVFIDPPYKDKSALSALAMLTRGGFLSKGAIVCLEAGEEFSGKEDELSGFEVIKNTSYGKKSSVLIAVYKPEESEYV
jgi:16S rRNA (guanine(966)-N(2))-methyltransferase RsmD